MLGFMACCMTACGANVGSTDIELYTHVLEAARSELGLPSTVTIHPLLALWPDDSPLDAPLTRFNAYDTTSVPGVIAANPAAYRLCVMSATGMCQPSPTEAAVVLSSLRTLNANSRALRLIVYDGRSGSDFYRECFVSLKRRWSGGWAAMDFKCLD
jgi:hypothetical protein